MKGINLICPRCGANLTINNVGSREYCFCEYCGTRIRLYDPNTTTYRYVDEARIREAELNAQLREKELDLRLNREDEYEKKSEFNRNFFKKRIFIYLAIAMAFGFLAFVVKDQSISVAFTIPSGIAMIALIYGSAGHAIALLVKRKRYK